MPQPSPGASHALAAFATDLRLDDLPAAVRAQAVRCLIDWLGCVLAGSATADLRRVRAGIRALDRVDGSHAAGILGTRQRTSPAFAALANGIAAHVLDFDDTFNPERTTIHGSAPLLSAITAASEIVSVSGPQAVEAFVAGFEVQARIGMAAGPAHYDAGWHVTGTVGHVGAAVATAKLLRLSTGQVLAALGTGATQAAGMKVVYGSTGKSLHAGKAAMDGLVSAFLAREGVTSAPDPIEGHRGFWHLFTEGPDPSYVFDGLGTEWYLPRNGFKPYACGSLTHPPAQALLHLRDEHGFEAADVVTVEAHVHDYVRTTTGLEEPESGLRAKFSICHVLATALLDGRLMPSQFTDEAVRRPDVVALRRLVRVHTDPDQTKDSARVVVTLRNGRKLEHAVAHNLGTPDNPMSDDQLTDKASELAGPVLGAESARRLTSTASRLLDLRDLRTVLDLAVPSK
ncbi:MAG: MmgE/PrpD family protein [Nocardioides sp.]